jgi:RNA polymerase sigma factor for flagellar operon FliA
VQLADKLAAGGADPTEPAERRDFWRVALGRLSRRERTVVRLYYWEGLTMAQIGRVMLCSESWICLIHDQAIFNLRATLELAGFSERSAEDACALADAG